jgi:hypothetical protein
MSEQFAPARRHLLWRKQHEEIPVRNARRAEQLQTGISLNRRSLAGMGMITDTTGATPRCPKVDDEQRHWRLCAVEKCLKFGLRIHRLDRCHRLHCLQGVDDDESALLVLRDSFKIAVRNEIWSQIDLGRHIP